MIPTLILWGAVFGRWWRFALVTATVGWPITLVAGDAMDVEPGLLAAAGLAAANTVVGVLLHHGGFGLARKLAKLAP